MSIFAPFREAASLCGEAFLNGSISTFSQMVLPQEIAEKVLSNKK
jgi:hypothetical protein